MLGFHDYYMVITLVSSSCALAAYQSLTTITERGKQFSPNSFSAQLISTSFVSSWSSCATACHASRLCRIFDYGAVVSRQCRLFEGNADTLGSIVPSPTPSSVVGSVQIKPSLFDEYGQPCSSACSESRYLMCGNDSVCQCMPHTYWDVFIGMCLAKSPILGSPCSQNMSMCREDLNYVCLQFNECGPLSLLSGVTIASGSTAIQGSAIAGLGRPTGFAFHGDEGSSLVVVDSMNDRTLYLQNIESINMTATMVGSEWGNHSNFLDPLFLTLDPRNTSNVYISDYGNHVVVVFYSMQAVDPSPQIVAGVAGTPGSALNQLNSPRGLALDSLGNLYIADQFNHRVVCWAPNATSGTVVVGQGSSGSDAMRLNSPKGLFLDEANALLYVADADNDRIQLFQLNESFPLRGITVAGGNGRGIAGHQLNNPRAMWVSKKAGALYVVDGSNHRIQKWKQGVNSGVTIAGSPYGIPGTDPTHLNGPYICILNWNETRMYVSDSDNGRILGFDLI